MGQPGGGAREDWPRTRESRVSSRLPDRGVSTVGRQCELARKTRGKWLLARSDQNSVRRLRPSSGHIRGNWMPGSGVLGSTQGSVAREALGHRSPGMVCSGEEMTRPEDWLTKTFRPQSKNSDLKLKREWRWDVGCVLSIWLSPSPEPRASPLGQTAPSWSTPRAGTGWPAVASKVPGARSHPTNVQ